MAARENQGYLIAVIILVLLSLVLALAAFLGFSSASENFDARTAAEQKNLLNEELASAFQIQGDAYLAMIGGHGPTPGEIETMTDSLTRIRTNPNLDSTGQGLIQEIIDRLETVKRSYDVESKQFDGTASDQTNPATYRELINKIALVVEEKSQDYRDQTLQAEAADKDRVAKVAAANSLVEQANTEMEKLRGELKQARADADENAQNLQGELDNANGNIEDLNRQIDAIRKQASETQQRQQNEYADLKIQYDMVKTKLNTYEREVYDRPDGRIVKVTSRLGTVFIDLGIADGLTNNRTFAVYDAAVTDFENSPIKAKIEVIKVNDFSAEARITDQDPLNPILINDHILTATWDPGNTVNIALAGFFDLDGDRFDDMEKLMRMIERNGGTVVARHDASGKLIGELDSSVRYLVLGNQPIFDSQAANTAVLGAMRSMEAQAEQNTVQIIDVQKLLNRMGVRNRPKTTLLDVPSGGLRAPQSRSLKSSDR